MYVDRRSRAKLTSGCVRGRGVKFLSASQPTTQSQPHSPTRQCLPTVCYIPSSRRTSANGARCRATFLRTLASRNSKVFKLCPRAALNAEALRAALASAVSILGAVEFGWAQQNTKAGGGGLVSSLHPTKFEFDGEVSRVCVGPTTQQGESSLSGAEFGLAPAAYSCEHRQQHLDAHASAATYVRRAAYSESLLDAEYTAQRNRGGMVDTAYLTRPSDARRLGVVELLS